METSKQAAESFEQAPEARLAAHSMMVPRGTPSSLPPGTFEPPALFCPFEPGLCAHVPTVQPRSVRWAVEHGLVRTDIQREKLDRSGIARLEGLVFHDASLEVLQLATDWTTLFCVLDDHLELQNLGPLHMGNYLQNMLSCMKGGGDPCDSPVGRAFGDLRLRMLDLAGEGWTQRFTAHLHDLFVAFVWEETNRWQQMRPSFEGYRAMRTITVGLRPQYLFGELCLDFDLSQEPELAERLQPLGDAACRAVGWVNDLFTYQKEVAQGEFHNMVLVLMQARNLPVSDAIRHAAHLHDEEVRNLLSLEHTLGGMPETHAPDYIHMLHCWIRGHLDWAEETARYRQRPSVPSLVDRMAPRP